MNLTFAPSGFTTTIPDTVTKRAAEYSSVMMDDAELSCLAGAALSFPWTPDALVVEIGSYEGMTAAFLAVAYPAVRPCCRPCTTTQNGLSRLRTTS